jgi:hypothetical protein
MTARRAAIVAPVRTFGGSLATGLTTSLLKSTVVTQLNIAVIVDAVVTPSWAVRCPVCCPSPPHQPAVRSSQQAAAFAAQGFMAGGHDVVNAAGVDERGTVAVQ